MLISTTAQAAPKYSIPFVGREYRQPNSRVIGAPSDARLHQPVRHCLDKIQIRDFSTKAEWLEYKQWLRTHILVGYGLLPEWEKTPLNAKVFDTIIRKDYKVSKVVFESVPGFYVCGNLYEPVKGKGPFPAVLNPHGHWGSRFRHDKLCSIPARCIGFARQGYVAFSWSMVGVDDMDIIRHGGGEMNDGLWSVQAGGLQLWNTIRAIDWITTLDNVDPSRIACTGASGGGQRTFFIGAVDDRIAVSAPVCIVSTTTHGGCGCANAHNLRIESNNIEIAGMMAPKPTILIAATGDWTLHNMEVEYPALRDIYKLFGAEDKVEAVIVDAGHNYNEDARNAVFAFFGKHLLGIDDPEKLKEQPIPELVAEDKFLTAECQKDLLVFTDDNPRPCDALDEEGMREYLTKQFRKKIDSLYPKDKSAYEKMKKVLWPVYEHVLFVSQPKACEVEVTPLGLNWDNPPVYEQGYKVERAILSRKDTGEMVPMIKLVPTGYKEGNIADVIIHSEGKSGLFDPDTGMPIPLVQELIAKGHTIVSIDCFRTGEFLYDFSHERFSDRRKGFLDESAKESNVPNLADTLFTGYNRTDDAWRIQDILTVIAATANEYEKVNLVGLGKAGLWCLAARPLSKGVNKTVVDASKFDPEKKEDWMSCLAIPGIRRTGGLKAAGAFSAPGYMLMHNTAEAFSVDWIKDAYKSLRASDKFLVYKEILASDKIAKYLWQNNNNH